MRPPGEVGGYPPRPYRSSEPWPVRRICLSEAKGLYGARGNFRTTRARPISTRRVTPGRTPSLQGKQNRKQDQGTRSTSLHGSSADSERAARSRSNRGFQATFVFFFRSAHQLRFAPLRRLRAAALISRRLGVLGCLAPVFISGGCFKSCDGLIEAVSLKLWSECGLQIHAQVSRLFESGNSLILLPVAAKMAFASAGAMTDTPGSPTPAGGALLSTT